MNELHMNVIRQHKRASSMFISCMCIEYWKRGFVKHEQPENVIIRTQEGILNVHKLSYVSLVSFRPNGNLNRI